MLIPRQRPDSRKKFIDDFSTMQLYPVTTFAVFHDNKKTYEMSSDVTIISSLRRNDSSHSRKQPCEVAQSRAKTLARLLQDFPAPLPTTSCNFVRLHSPNKCDLCHHLSVRLRCNSRATFFHVTRLFQSWCNFHDALTGLSASSQRPSRSRDAAGNCS